MHNLIAVLFAIIVWLIILYVNKSRASLVLRADLNERRLNLGHKVAINSKSVEHRASMTDVVVSRTDLKSLENWRAQLSIMDKVCKAHNIRKHELNFK